MDKKSYIQISIIFGIGIIIIFVYVNYFKNSAVKKVNNDVNNVKSKLIKETGDVIKQMSYFSEDNKGNKYEINSQSGFINPDKSNLIIMNDVNAVIFLLNGEKIYINSNKAKYNDDNSDTTFSGSVKIVYSDHEVISEQMNLSFKDQTAVLYDRVNYKSKLTNLRADRVFLDFLSKNTKIEMNNEESSILVRSKLKNVSN